MLNIKSFFYLFYLNLLVSIKFNGCSIRTLKKKCLKLAVKKLKMNTRFIAMIKMANNNKKKNL